MFRISSLTALVIIGFSFGQNHDQNTNNNNYKNSYYFKIGKNNNEFKVNNRIYFLNHNITDYVYPNGEVQSIKKSVVEVKERKMPIQFKSNCYLDEEWNYNSTNKSRPELPLFIQKFYEKRTFDPTIQHTTRILFNTNNNSTSRIIKLNLDSLQEDESVSDADLYFYWPLKNTSEIFKQSVVLRLYQFEKQYNVGLNESNLVENPDIHKLFNVIYVSKAHKGWQTFKLKKPIENWLNGEDNLGLLLTISSYDNNKLIEVYNDTNQGIYRTFAVIKILKNDSVVDSQSSASDEATPISSCQRTDWTIDFSKLGWDSFIISPTNFTAYDCAGKCGNSFEESIGHVKLLNIFHKRSSCCVPVEYEPLSIMYYDQHDNVIIKSYDDIVVTECGCR